MIRVVKFLTLFLFTISVLVMSACSTDVEAFVETHATPAEQEIFQDVIQSTLSKDTARIFEEAHSVFNADVDSSDMEAFFLDMDFGTEIQSNTYIGYYTYTEYELGEGKARTVEVLSEIETEKMFVLLSHSYAEEDGRLRLYNLDANGRSYSLIEAYKFGNAPLTWRHLVIVVLMLIVWGVMFYAAYLCLKYRQGRWWLWLVLVFFGFHAVFLDWTTGELSHSLFSVEGDSFSISLFLISFFSSEITKASIAAPWIFGVYFPLFALIYIWRHKRGYYAPVLEDGVE